MKLGTILFSSSIVISLFATGINAKELKVNITRSLADVEVVHNGEKITIQRNQDTRNTVNPTFSKTSRKCPPFCINPMVLAPGVETLGELELINYIKKISDGDKSILVVDSRTPSWVKKGTIPGSVNIPWTLISVKQGVNSISVSEILAKHFNVKEIDDDKYDFSQAKTLVLFCNGMWCGQSPSNIRSLLNLGYPAEKIKWYRGGMQNWENLGFNVVKDESID